MKLVRLVQTCLLALVLILLATPGLAVAATCESLAALNLPDTTITLAQAVAAGAFIPPGESVPPASVKNLPAFCRVAATIKPAKDSEIKMEVWLPLTGWNGKYRGEGNGGFAGSIFYPGLATAVSQGYASASTDTGHSGSPVDAHWALGHPDKIVDFGWRAIHEMTVKAKSVIQAFYGDAPRKSYFTGCSNGGRQALMEAQRFPEDYDGIIAGAPANYWTKVFATFIWDIQAMQAKPGSYIGANKIPAIARAVVAACDAYDGVKDGVLNDPRACRFHQVLLCKERDSDSCLTPPQEAALKKIYDGPVDAKGKQIFPGFLPGGEEGEGGWVTWIDSGPGKDLQSVFAHGFYTNMISSKEPVNLKTIDVETAVKLADEQQGQTFNAVDPNLKPFAARGGKLIMYHGWSDAALPPQGSINYYNSVEAAMGPGKPELFMRLFMAPGMQHCGGGPGTNSFGQFAPGVDADHDLNQALERWVEKGIAPDRLIATKFVDDKPEKGVAMTRPLCPYPAAATFKGTGDTNDAANFGCSVDAALARMLNDPGGEAPRPLSTPEPKYSKSARKQKIEGVVTLSVVIGTDGMAHDVKVVKSLEPTLDANAIAAVKTWKFAPATKDGRPVAVAMRLEVAFKL
ncbi:MAG TPA: TonB family protein [Candidatus Angelobacter sp.]|nr:TonB family protein [Candidatus Angelobacter sp.]